MEDKKYKNECIHEERNTYIINSEMQGRMAVNGHTFK